MHDEEFRREVRECFEKIHNDIKALAKQTAETNTTMIMRGGIFDRLDHVETAAEKASEKAGEARQELNTIKAKVAFAAACVSALVAAVWAVLTHLWKANP